MEKVCRRIFNYRQKYVNKGVRSLYPKELAKNLADDLLKRCRIDPTTTAICLGVEQFADMCYVYEEHCRKYFLMATLLLYNNMIHCFRLVSDTLDSLITTNCL